ncbi:HutD/Ves family protein [Solimonas variicoloris]|uniref:HutD/Ves family protein n=1 Tax=Solimonas variicoloris TaxID=254408 RepID=UPI000373128A|nr:HutD family protein [Solimonas variicoloris]
MRILRSSNYQRMPWKNGGGETFEIAVSPPAASLDTLDWRVSMAVVAGDGPFSRFADIDRTLCVLEGEGLRLAFADDGSVRTLDRAAPPFAFDADRPVQAQLLGAAVTDLNTMTRRGRYRHTVSRAPIGEILRTQDDAEALLVFCTSGRIRVHTNEGAEAELGTHDCVVLQGPQDPRALTLFSTDAAAASALLIEIECLL